MPRWVRQHPRLRQVVIQLRKRSPIDLGPLLGVAPFVMAKTLGSTLIAAARRQPSSEAAQEAASIAMELRTGDVARLGGGAWGYEFDVQTRWAYYPEGSPNIISTFFVARGFAEAWAACMVADGAQEAVSSARYISRSLRAPEGFFAYTPGSPRLVHNANLLGAGLVGAVGRLTGDEGLVEQALGACRMSLGDMRDDGSLPYGRGPGLEWIDNFHTAYCLDGLLLLWLATGDQGVHDAMELAAASWSTTFFDPCGAPRYYAQRKSPYPYDIHSAATAVDVASRLESWGFDVSDVARRVDLWTRSHLIAPDGRTLYRRNPWFTDGRHFVRWGDAHWAMACSSRSMVEGGRRSPLEERLHGSAPSAGLLPTDTGATA